MEYKTTPQAEEDLEKMDKTLREFFIAHFRKIKAMPPRRHLQHGVPFHVEDVTKQARFTYEIVGDIFVIVRCFTTHKEYERWYKG